jgi:hypothetical protein
MTVLNKIFAWLKVMSQYSEEQVEEFKGWDMIPGETDQ